jgi:thymidine kinase
MIHVFCGRKGSGKTKALIKLANEKVDGAKGNIVYIDDDTKAILQLSGKMRFVATNEFNLKSNNDFYGFLCGMLSKDYDIDTIFVDGVFNIVDDKFEHTAQLFSKMDSLAKKYNVEFYVNVSCETLNPPEFLKNYIA